LVRVEHGVRLWVDRETSPEKYYLDAREFGWVDGQQFDSPEDARGVFDNCVKAVKDQREASLSDAGADAHLALRLELEKRGPRTLWGVLREDSYETAFGDGYYAFLKAAFDNRDDAVFFIVNNHRCSINWHIRQYELQLIEGVPVVIAPSDPFEPHPRRPGTIYFGPTSEQEPVTADLLITLWDGLPEIQWD
jgi:hypothetical protein